ncbi:MAG: hypothetical protein DIU70_009935 [Bacillota bacterium]|nr:MAG: hypothetical protein DIU70_04985 [Bacillota bacterium]
MERLQAHLTLVVVEGGRVVRVEHAHLTGGAAEQVVAGWAAREGHRGQGPGRGRSKSRPSGRAALGADAGACPTPGRGRGRAPAAGEDWVVPVCLVLALCCLVAAYLLAG